MVNVNDRYKADELSYVLANSGARALVYHAAFAPRVAEVRAALPTLRHLIQMRDDSDTPLLPGALDYEELRARQPTDPLDLPYSPDDLYILYTGGTTGIPKGVLWRQEDVFFNGLGGHVPGFERLDSEEKLRSHVALGIGGRAIVLLPFMHGAGQWLSFNSFHRGGTLVFPDEGRRLDAEGAWRTVERHQVDQMMIIGDAFARPLIAALRAGRHDVSSVRVVGSTAAVLSPAVKQELMALLPEGTLSLESIGGSEMGLQAMSYDTDSGQPGVPAYQLRENTVLLRGDRSGVLSPGTDELGWIATRGHLPFGYLGDPERQRQNFPVSDGARFCVGGDRRRAPRGVPRGRRSAALVLRRPRHQGDQRAGAHRRLLPVGRRRGGALRPLPPALPSPHAGLRPRGRELRGLPHDLRHRHQVDDRGKRHLPAVQRGRLDPALLPAPAPRTPAHPRRDRDRARAGRHGPLLRGALRHPRPDGRRRRACLRTLLRHSRDVAPPSTWGPRRDGDDLGQRPRGPRAPSRRGAIAAARVAIGGGAPLPRHLPDRGGVRALPPRIEDRHRRPGVARRDGRADREPHLGLSRPGRAPRAAGRARGCGRARRDRVAHPRRPRCRRPAHAPARLIQGAGCARAGTRSSRSASRWMRGHSTLPG